MCRAGVLPCSLLQGAVGPTKQNPKNLIKFTKIDKVVEIKHTKYQTLKPKIKQVAGFPRLLKMTYTDFDFLIKLAQLTSLNLALDLVTYCDVIS